MSGLFNFQAPPGYRQAIDARVRSPDEGPESNWFKFDPNAPDYDFSQGLPQGPSIGRPVEQQPMPDFEPEFSTSIGLPGGPGGQTQFQPMPGYQQPPQGQQPGPGGLFTPIFNQIGGRISDAMFGPRQDNQQYYQQMRQNIDGMNEALKQIEGVNTPGGMYRGGGNGAGRKTGKGTALF